MFSFSSSDTVNQFTIQEYKFCLEETTEGNTVSAQFIFNRGLIGSLLNDFLPIFISVLVGHLTNYFKLFKAAAATNIMVLLVLVTL